MLQTGRPKIAAQPVDGFGFQHFEWQVMQERRLIQQALLYRRQLQ
jgi:hypothetical protein